MFPMKGSTILSKRPFRPLHQCTSLKAIKVIYKVWPKNRERWLACFSKHIFRPPCSSNLVLQFNTHRVAVGSLKSSQWVRTSCRNFASIIPKRPMRRLARNRQQVFQGALFRSTTMIWITPSLKAINSNKVIMKARGISDHKNSISSKQRVKEAPVTNFPISLSDGLSSVFWKIRIGRALLTLSLNPEINDAEPIVSWRPKLPRGGTVHQN